MSQDSCQCSKRFLGIFPRVVLFTLTIVVLVLGAFTITLIQREERILLAHLESRAELLAASVDRVCANAIVAEEQWAVVEQFQKMVDISAEVRYAVITRQSDGDSLVFTENSWKVDKLVGKEWIPKSRESNAYLKTSLLVSEEVLHYAYPLSYEGYEWGWIHVGMSLNDYKQSVADFYQIILIMLVPAILLGLGLSFLFARKSTRPIAKLREFAQRIASGDLKQRVSVKSHDEVGDLATSLNAMAEDLETSLKRDAELREKDILLKEIHHRVKNNMQILSSLLRLQARRSPSEQMQAFLQESESRIRSMGLIHEKLYQSNSLSEVDFESYAQTLTAELRRMYGGANADVKISLDVADVKLGLDTALPCGLILNELVSNSFKYAFPDGQSGKIVVSMKPLDDSRFQFSVSDDGVGLSHDTPAREGSLGGRLVSTLTQQINGELATSNGVGLTTTIRFSESKYTQRL